MPRSIWALALLVTLVVLGCPGSKPPQPATPKPAPPKPAPEAVAWQMSKSGLGFRLSDARGAGDRARPAAAVSALPEAEIRALLARLPPVESSPDDEKSFAFRGKSLPPPRPGKTIAQAFPPPPSAAPAPAPKGGPLEVLRFAPEGEVPLAPSLSVTFSRPMVALTSHAELEKSPVPVRLSPKPPGSFRWVGSQTVVFQPEKRFPMATDFSVEIPAGTEAAGGEALREAKRFAFSTPAVTLLRSHPAGGSVGLEPVLFAEFDQEIDEEALLAVLRVEARGQVPVRPATEAEVLADPVVRRLVAKAEPRRYLALKTLAPLPRDTAVSVIFPSGTPSAEGPKKTRNEQRFGFKTYGPLRLVSGRCGWGGSCPPLSPWYFTLSNAIDDGAFSADMVRVEPALPDVKVEARGGSLVVYPRSKGRTTYKITLARTIRDTFGQTLGEDARRTITVGSAEPVLFSEENEMAVLDPAGKPELSVHSVNHASLKVRLYRVGPEDWSDYLDFRREEGRWEPKKKPTAPPGKRVHSGVLRVGADRDELASTRIDLSPALTDGLGQVLVIVEPTRQSASAWDREQYVSWIQVTRLGLDTTADADHLLAFATALETGAPAEGAEVSILGGPAVRVDASGLAELTYPADGGRLAVARKNKDVVILPERWGGSLRPHRAGPELKWFVFDDRKTYKPGEDVRIKGWVRELDPGKRGDVRMIASPAGRALRFKVRDPRGQEIASGEARLDASAGFDLGFRLPKDANLGSASIALELEGAKLPGGSFWHAISIQEFRRPEFEVSASVGEGPHFVGGRAIATAAAKYYAGGGLPGAEVKWRVKSETATFSPPGRPGFSFGEAPRPWWSRGRSGPSSGGAAPAETWDARTNGDGEHGLRIDFDALEDAFPMRLDLEASVTDVNRQAWTARESILVHPGETYVGLRHERAFVRAGEPIRVDALAVDLEGKAAPGRKIAIRAARVESRWVEGELEERDEDVETCEVTSAEEPAACSLPTKKAGTYRLRATVTDRHGRRNQSELRVWVAGADLPKDLRLDGGKVEVVASKAEYKAGEVAELLVVAPFAPAEGVLTLRRAGVIEVRRFRLEKRVQPLSVKIEAAHAPNVFAHVRLVGQAPREDARGAPDPGLPGRPAYASGAARLAVPPEARRLAVEVKPDPAELAPGGKTQVVLEVRDAAGRPVAGAEVALVVADEAVLALSGYRVPDPIPTFYPERPAGARDLASRAFVLLELDPSRLAGKISAPEPPAPKNGRVGVRNGYGGGSGGLGGLGTMGMGAGAAPGGMARPAPPPLVKASAQPLEAASRAASAAGGAPGTPIAVRRDFRPLAAFVPRIVTGADGRVSASVALPESLTRYRAMAVAVEGAGRFGLGEATIVARHPLMVRPSPPRFLSFGDRFELPVVLQNQTGEDLRVDLAVRAQNARLLSGAGRRVTVPARDRVEVRLPAAAASPGTARFQIAASASGGRARFADASEVSLPVWTPATTEAFATYGTLDEGAVLQPVRAPSDAVPEFGGLEVTTSSTALSALTDAVLYLVRYPYECNEQIASRLLAVAALRDVLSAFQAEGLPRKAALVASAAGDIERLGARQHWSGGWGFWPSPREPSPYVSVHVAHTLQRAREKGFSVPEDTLARAQKYLVGIESRIPRFYSEDSRRALVAYALYVRGRMGAPDPGRARRLLGEAGGPKGLSFEALGWLLPTLSADPGSLAELEAVRQHLTNRVSETAGAAHFVTSYSDGEHVLLHSERRADAVILESLIGDQPESDLIPKLVTGLLAHRKAGRWKSTQENAFVLLALDRYFGKYEKVTPDFVARLWLGRAFAGEQRFKGRSADRQHVDVPMKLLAAENRAGEGLVLSKDGPGRLYYRIGMTYAPRSLRLPPLERGFSVTRRYEPVDASADVRRDPDGTWRIRRGAAVRVRISMVAPARRYHVALVDPLPAGLEPSNPALAVTGTIPEDPAASEKKPAWSWFSSWYEHENMRDERVEAFASLLYAGSFEYTYVARATTPGTFVAPPPKAEEMYSPETFGRGASDVVVVE